ncbi:lytic transglycosylase domain-containing protein [Raoultella ornithinolytica]|uniref:lytic transglycosylase domain-containing protein n=1 Tax=Raoultella ornithinolytica TaxID=54291 RepID=UPI0025B50676|nr:lytic transglycosylase domain-containing protein [Raoultella ornithinolytica]MDN3785114.1 lytic transglycosylase domain-containing protein [Raoultella ornithinolytica]
MAATVIDALLVTLGLDTSQFRKGQQEVSDDLKKQREDAKNTAKEMAEQGKKAASFFSSIKTELLALTGVTVTAGGLMSFVKSTTSGLMDLSIQSKALGLSARELDGWSKSAEAAGSSAEKISASLQGFQGAIQGARVGDYSSSIFGGLAQLNALTGQNFDVWGQDASSLAKTSLDALRKISDPNLRRQVGLSLGFDDATLQRNQEGKFLPDVDRLTKNSGISDESINGAKEFNSAWAELNQNLDTTKNQFYTFLIPYVREFNGVLRDLSDWMKSHPKEMKAGIDAFFGAIKDVAAAANDAADAVGEWKKVIVALLALKVASWFRGIAFALSGPGGLIFAITALYPIIDGLLSKIVSKENREWMQNHGIFWTSNGEFFLNKKDAEERQRQIDSGAAPNGSQRTVPNAYQQAMMDTQMDLSTAMKLDVGQYQPNIPLNAKAAKLGIKGKSFLQAMAGEFGALEGKYGLPAGLLSSVAATESGGDPFAESKAGAKGLFQFMPGTAKDMGLKGRDVYDPHKSAEAAAKYLRWLMDATGGDLEKTLASYNWGLGNVQKKGMDNLPSETRNYVPKVMAGMRPGAGMAVDRAMPGQSGATYQFYGTKITTQAQNVEQLTSDIKKHGDNRVMLLAGYSGQ